MSFDSHCPSFVYLLYKIDKASNSVKSIVSVKSRNVRVSCCWNKTIIIICRPIVKYKSHMLLAQGLSDNNLLVSYDFFRSKAEKVTQLRKIRKKSIHFSIPHRKNTLEK